jgi:hypothetical protein
MPPPQATADVASAPDWMGVGSTAWTYGLNRRKKGIALNASPIFTLAQDQRPSRLESNWASSRPAPNLYSL